VTPVLLVLVVIGAAVVIKYVPPSRRARLR
jgi:hypothetical protein